MQSGIEGLVKLALVAVLAVAGLAVWLLPKTGLVKRRIGETAFVVTCVTGVVCGAVGLLIMFAWPRQVLEWHLWELAVMPVALAYAYWLVVMRSAHTVDVLDEKQELDTAGAGNLTLGITILAMGVAFVLHDEGLFEAALWFPYYLVVTLLVYSATALHRFKRR